MRIKSIFKSLKALLVFGAIFLGSSHIKAQQEPLYTQYMFNTISVNPGYTGTRNALNMVFLSRLQWVGLDGAPKTNTFSMHTPIANNKMGVGFSVVADDIGPVRNSYLAVDYAYKVNVTSDIILSMGLKGGIFNYYAGLQDVFLGNPNADPSFYGNLEQKLQPNAGVGFYLYSNKYYAGFSIPSIIEASLSDYQESGTTPNSLKRHYFIMGGYVFDLGTEWKFKPAFIEKVVTGAPLSTDLTAHFIYQNTYWMGMTYRVGDAISLLLELQVTRQLLVGYSYDYTLSNISSYSNGSHEIVISYDFDGFMKSKVKSPRFF
ncbi:MAG: type IX secretion system membrane protein PorP/SprF [Breznakibacter sp.]|nr:type IX secretion system membrane protein PorP/SprF [Breznakibacter sp.]